MTYRSLSVLVPCHGWEDFPYDLPEEQAEGLLNAFAVLWHPVLLDGAESLPRWHRADEDPPEVSDGQLVVIPSVCDDWLPGGWQTRITELGGTIVHGIAERDALLAAVLEPLDEVAPVDADLTADFLALGHVWLQTQLLSRHMRNFNEVDQHALKREALAAAKSALSADRPAAETHLMRCFELLLEFREQFYPVTCYLVDLCLFTPDLADEHFDRLMQQDSPPVNLLASAADLAELNDRKPEIIQRMAVRQEEGSLDIIGGEQTEAETPLRPLESLIDELRQGLRTYQDLFDRRPRVWGRRRFGLVANIPQILKRFGFQGALHYVMDDGLYPDDEQSKCRWEGCDGSVIEATTRLPLAGDGAASFLRFPMRMQESMDADHVALVTFARWPELRTPWLEDFRRMSKYGPVLGEFTTLTHFLAETDPPGRLLSPAAGDYFSPYFLQSVARQEADPISRYVNQWRQHHEQEAYGMLNGLADLLSAAGDEPCETMNLAAGRLADVIMSGAAEGQPGRLLINPLSSPRRHWLGWTGDQSPVRADESVVKSLQIDETGGTAVVELPGCGFVWLPDDTDSSKPTSPGKTPLAEGNVLRNDFFEMKINETTGGIGEIRSYGRSPNRLSQHLAFRFSKEQTVTTVDGDDEETVRTFYSRMQCDSLRILSAGPALGEIETTGRIVAPTNDDILATFTQRYRVTRGRPVIDVRVTLDTTTDPTGNPWLSYYCARFAWPDETAAITQSIYQGAHISRAERLESPHLIEIASDERRTTILPCGLPFHRMTGGRMLDTLLIVEGETDREFRFAITIDENDPVQAARDAMTPVAIVNTQTGPPAVGTQGWFFHTGAKNVQLTGIRSLPDSSTGTEGCQLRLRETEGRHRTIRLQSYRTPRSARQVNLLGETIAELTIDSDAVLVEITKYELCDVELIFD